MYVHFITKSVSVVVALSPFPLFLDWLLLSFSPAAHFDYVLSALGNGEAPPPSNAMATVPELESLVRRVKEVLPHLGSAFISVSVCEMMMMCSMLDTVFVTIV